MIKCSIAVFLQALRYEFCRTDGTTTFRGEGELGKVDDTHYSKLTGGRPPALTEGLLKDAYIDGRRTENQQIPS